MAGAHRSSLPQGGSMKIMFLAAAALSLSACMTNIGTNYSEAAVQQLRVGMTKAEVISLLGQPNQVINQSDGTTRLIWVHSKGSIGGANARSIGLPFDESGLLMDIPE